MKLTPARVKELARTREFREVRLSAPIMAWLRARGLRPFAECPNWDSPIDVVGVSHGMIVAVELKMNLTRGVLRKAICNQVSANESWCAVASKPRKAGIETCRDWGVGLLVITGGVANSLVGATIDMLTPLAARLERTRQWAQEMNEGGDGGLPNMAGEGPAQDCERRIDEYRMAHSKATWAHLFANVPNDYANPRSMAGAMANVYSRRARKKWRHAQALAAAGLLEETEE